MDAGVCELLRSLRTAESVEPAWEEIDKWVARRRDAPYLASLFASGQTFHVAERLVAEARVDDDEFLACLTQEFVLRNAPAEREPFESLRRRLREQRHPLGWLPLHLTQIEGGVELPYYDDRGGMAYSRPFGPTHDDDQPETAFATRVGKEITSAAEARLCSKAFQDWIENSNGKVEARFFELTPAPEVVPLAPALAATALDCLAGATALHAVDARATDAFRLAFAAASTGGAYGHGHRGAYGRLEAWATLAGLAGQQAEAPFEAVSAAVESTRWFRFEADAPWFYGVAWDVGLVAERSGGRSLAVLAATDTD